MPLANIVDNRSNEYAWKRVWGVVEPTTHDNSIAEADKASVDGSFTCEWTKTPGSLAHVLHWASKFDGEVTLYLYDYNPMSTDNAD